MKEVVQLLRENQYGFLATVDEGRPKVRPFGFMFAEEGRLYFCTNSKKEVYRQLNEVPFVEYSVTSKDMVTVRVGGRVTFCEDRDKKEKALNSSEIVKRAYQSADNPIFKVFYIEHGQATIADFSGKPPRRVEF
ncbi:MAG TPA: pyridoxamine 5'-phosphate oxidase family protein [Bacillota bacterium]|nr:pyridoxamine 5'-phosphate oxidase family protein [Bacillota bacterium]